MDIRMLCADVKLQNAAEERQCHPALDYYDNEFKTYVVVGMKRSGHHAVVQWLSGGVPGVVNYHNDCSWSSKRRRRLMWHNFDHLYRGRKIQGDVRESTHRATIYSFEDIDISRGLPEVPPVRDASGHVVIGAQPTYILVIRDPRNWLASCLAAARRVTLGKRCFDPTNKLKTYYSHCANAWRPEWNVIRFDSFIGNPGYRQEVARLAKLQFTDAGLDVLAMGAGSSFFSQRRFEESGKSLAEADMDVLNRYQRFEGDAEYEQLLAELLAMHRPNDGVQA